MALDDGRVISNFAVQALRGTPLTIYGDGSQSRSFCYVDDLIEGIFRIATGPPFSGPVNLGNPGEFTILELAKRVIDLADSKSPLVNKPAPNDDPKHRQPDITRARALLNFSPKTSLTKGLNLTINDFRNRITILREQQIAKAKHGPSESSNELVVRRAGDPAEGLSQALTSMAAEAAACGDAHRTGDHMAAAQGFIRFVDNVNRLAPALETLEAGNDNEPATDMLNQLVTLIEQLCSAQQAQDTLRIADLLEYEMQPLLERLHDNVTT
jgi:hypothetical protein